MGWNLSGELIETCSCNVLCPCWYGVQELMKMDQGYCHGAIVIRATKGSSNGVDLGGTTAVLANHFPGPTLFDGNATARLHIDQSASEDQRRELESILQGKQGGPMEAIGGLVSTWLPTNYCRIDVEDDGKKLTAKVGDLGRISSEVLENDSGDAMTVQNAGFALAFQFDEARFKIAPSDASLSDPEMPQPIRTASGARSSYNWAVA